RIPLPRGTRLSEIPVKPSRPRRADLPRDFDKHVRSLFKKITSLEMTWPLIRDMSDDLRLETAERICDHLMASAGFLRRDAEAEEPAEGEELAELLADDIPPPEIYLTPP